jgi:hypothetical protein
MTSSLFYNASDARDSFAVGAGISLYGRRWLLAGGGQFSIELPVCLFYRLKQSLY